MSLMRIPNLMLNKLMCSDCQEYLSKAPVYVKPNGANICQDCYKSPAMRCKLYETIASLFMFPCFYHIKGCNFLFQFNKSEDHQKTCPYRGYACFDIQCDWAGTISELHQHYENEHKEVCLKEPKIVFDVLKDHKNCYNFVRIESSQFLLYVDYTSESKEIFLNAVYLGEIGLDKYVRYSVKLSNQHESDRSVSFDLNHPLPITEGYLCLEKSRKFDLSSLCDFFNATILHCEFKVTFLSDFNRIDTIERQVVTCPDCKLAIVPPIYCCTLGHLICADCKGNTNICAECKESEFSRAVDLENVAHLQQFYCRWNKCNVQLDCLKIRSHEYQCTKRVYSCPECKAVIGAFYKLPPHFKNHHKEIVFRVVKTQTVRFASKDVLAYVYVHKELFKVVITPDILSSHSVIIIYNGLPSLESYFNYEVRSHSNVLHYASKVCNNYYKVSRIPYCSSEIRSENFITIKFNRRKDEELWIPFDDLPDKLCV